ncbi:hypothetical protein AAFC00_005026 [Neodothiora populina]|uniref:Lung carbonyl reductase n=1 Tax=Neodothiora populina TaxID=2781224 RepID=A0ABR3P3Z1_9PEZI
MSAFSLKGRTALVTGGARGCGLAFAEALAEAGADVAIFDVINPDAAFGEFSKKYGVKTAHYHVDVSSPESLETGFARFKEEFGGALDICVPCAGVNKDVGILDTTPQDFDRLANINFKGVYFTTQMAAKMMIANKTKKGSIIVVASIASYRAIRGQCSSAYCATKGAVKAMVPPVAVELAPYGIRVNSVSPGYIRTEMTAAFPHIFEPWRKEIMSDRVGVPEDLRGACVFLASDASSYITSQDIVIDGGVLQW